MGLFGDDSEDENDQKSFRDRVEEVRERREGGEDVILENADLDCKPQNEYVSKTEIKKIDEDLEPGEKVHFFASHINGGLKIDGQKQGDVMNLWTVATDRRILFKTGKLIGGKQTSIDYKDISSVEVSFGLVQKRLNLETNSKVFGIGVGQIGKDEVKDMAQFIRRKMKEASQQNATSPAGQKVNDSEVQAGDDSEGEEEPLDKLERLGELRDNGVITEEEFQEKKQSLLDQI